MYVIRQQTPQVVQRGVAVTRSIVVYDDDGVAVTATAGSYRLTIGSTVVTLADATVTPGATSTVALAAADTSGLDLTDQLLEVWTLTVDGVPHEFSRPGYLVRRQWWPVITDTDLVDLHSILDDEEVKPVNITSYKRQRNAARDRVLRMLIRDGLNPHLMHDAYQFHDALTWYSLHLIFKDFFSALGSETFKVLSDEYLEKFGGADGKTGEYADAASRYDLDEDGTLNEEEAIKPGGGVTLTAGRPDSWRRWGLM